jgi:cell division protein FtsB
MFEFHEKRKFKSLLYSKPFLIGMCIPIAFLSVAAYKAYERKEETSAKREELSANLMMLQQRAEELEKDIERLDDPRGIEAELRSRYEVGWEGEEVIVLVEEEKRSLKESDTQEEEVGFWKRLFD